MLHCTLLPVPLCIFSTTPILHAVWEEGFLPPPSLLPAVFGACLFVLYIGSLTTYLLFCLPFLLALFARIITTYMPWFSITPPHPVPSFSLPTCPFIVPCPNCIYLPEFCALETGLTFSSLLFPVVPYSCYVFCFLFDDDYLVEEFCSDCWWVCMSGRKETGWFLLLPDVSVFRICFLFPVLSTSSSACSPAIVCAHAFSTFVPSRTLFSMLLHTLLQLGETGVFPSLFYHSLGRRTGW